MADLKRIASVTFSSNAGIVAYAAIPADASKATISYALEIEEDGESPYERPIDAADAALLIQMRS
jgi:hypothetical protein